MLNQATLDKLHALRLTGMAEAYQKQLDEPEARGLNFEERFGMLVDSIRLSNAPCCGAGFRDGLEL
jgi:hypothetical protein